MVAKKLLQGALALTSVAVLAGCAQMGGGHITKGNSPSEARGGAAGSSSVNANSSLERCDAPLGTIAMDDGRDKDWYDAFGSATKITTIEPLLRLAVQQSNCFVITSIGNSRTEARLAAITDKQRNSGEFRAGSKQHKGQRVAADYLMEPAIIIDNDSTGKVAGGLAGFLGSGLGALAGSLESKVSVVTLSLYDIRSGVQCFGRQCLGHQLRCRPGHAGWWCSRRPGGLLAHAGRQGHGGCLHGRLQQHGHLAAQLQGAAGQGWPGPRWRAEGG